MSLTTFLLEIVLVAAGSFGLRQRRDWLFVLAIAAGLAGSVVSLAQYYVTGGIWWFAPWDLLLAPSTGVVVMLAVSQTRSRLRTSDADFDRELYRSLVELHDILDEGPTQRDHEVKRAWTANAYERATTVLNRLERITPPSPEWNDLQAGYIELTRKIVATIHSGVTSDQRKGLVHEGDELSRRYESLRAVLRNRGNR